MSMSDPSGVVVPCLYDSSGGYVMSLQKTSLPALEIDAGAVIDAPLPAVVVVVVDSLLLLLLPPPLPARARRRTIAPASTKVFERNTGELLSLIGLPKIRLSHLFVAEKRLRVVRESHLAGLEHVATARHLERHHRVLLDEQDGRALLVDLDDRLEDPLDEDRGEPHRRLVEQQERRMGHERPADRDHLLLAAGECSGLLLLSFREPGKERVDPFEVAAELRAVTSLECAHLEVLEHGHAGEELAALRRLRNAEPYDVVGWFAGDVRAAKHDRSAPRMVEPVDRAKHGRLSGAVRADQGHDLAFVDLDRDSFQRFDRAVVGVHFLDREQRAVLRGRRHDVVAALPR